MSRPSLWRDPVLWAGVVLLALLGFQYANSGRPLVYDSEVAAWVYGPPPHPGWPFAYDSAEARQMITWFLPAWALALAVRSRTMPRGSARELLVFVALNSAMLSLFGIVQRMSGTGDLYWATPMPGHFFASFGYENHAASFFLLTSMVSGGLVLDEVFSGATRPIRPAWVAAFCAALALNLAGVLLTYSRAGIVIAALALAAGILYATVASRRLIPAVRVKFLASLVGLCLLGWFAVGATCGPTLMRELRSLTGPVVTSPHPDAPRSSIPVLLDRIPVAKAALAMWRAHPWFGVGGWGFRYEYLAYVPREYTFYLGTAGKANVHNDALQFLAEFGAVGAGSMAVAVAALGLPLLRRRSWRSPLVVLSALGVGAVAAHSLVDLPFRSPAILYTWTVVLAAAASVASSLRSRRLWSPSVQPRNEP